MNFSASNIKKIFFKLQVCSECLKKMTSDNKCSLCDLPVCNDQCQMGHNHYIECQILRNFRNKIRGQQELKQMSILPIRILATCDTSKFTYAKSKLFHQELSNEGDYLHKKIFSHRNIMFFACQKPF